MSKKYQSQQSAPQYQSQQSAPQIDQGGDHNKLITSTQGAIAQQSDPQPKCTVCNDAFPPEWHEVRRATLGRPILVPGNNLAGIIGCGMPQPTDPRAAMQDRIFWVQHLRLLPNGWLSVAKWQDASPLLISPSILAWLE